MENNKTICCTRIVVDCIQNSEGNILCGGPEYLGFVFDVKSKDVNEMHSFIIEVLHNLDIPYIRVYRLGKLNINADMVWTRTKIMAAISKDSKYLKSELNNNYCRKRKKN